LEVFSYLEKWSLETCDHEEYQRPLSKVKCKEDMENLDFFNLYFLILIFQVVIMLCEISFQDGRILTSPC